MKKLIHFLKDWRNQAKYLAWLIQYSKPYIPKIGLLMFIDIIAAVATTYMAILNKKIVDGATSGATIKSALFIYVLIMFASLGFDVLTTMLSVTLDEKFSFGIRKQIYEQIIHSHWMDVKRFHTGDLMTRLTSDAGNVANGIIYVIPTIIKLIFELIITFFTLFYYQPILAVFALVLGPIAALSSFWLGRKLKRLQVKVQESESAYRSYLQESLANLLVVKSFANEDYATERLVQLRDDRFYWIYKKTKLGLVGSTTMSFTFQFGYLVAFTYGALKLTTKAITYGTMTLFLMLVNRVQAPVINLAQQIPKVVSILASAGRVMELENIPLEKREEQNLDTSQGVGIELEEVSFAYAGEKDKVFHNASLSIRPGEFVAIVGESGIGKTTLIRLMMSFMSNYEGSIAYTNKAGEVESTNAGIREFVSYVPQGNTLFSGSIRYNILMGKQDATEEEIIEALKMAAAYDFVMELPNGVDTVIGERGHGISEGQAQRIAIARALIRKSPFLILDEATSSLDGQTELEVLKGIQNLSPRPTCLLITHRLSVLPYCDRQIKIDDRQVTSVI